MSPDEDQYEFLLQQLRQRIEEGQGETIYEIGLGGNLFTLTLLAPACLSVCKFSLYYPYKIHVSYSKWFEPRSISSSFSVIVRVSVVLKRTVGDMTV